MLSLVWTGIQIDSGTPGRLSVAVTPVSLACSSLFTKLVTMLTGLWTKDFRL